jgi:flavorubredoxin
MILSANHVEQLHSGQPINIHLPHEQTTGMAVGDPLELGGEQLEIVEIPTVHSHVTGLRRVRVKKRGAA